MDEEDTDDLGSTLVRSGKSALTFTEMAAFVHDLAARPAPRLLQDLPGLMTRKAFLAGCTLLGRPE